MMIKTALESEAPHQRVWRSMYFRVIRYHTLLVLLCGRKCFCYRSLCSVRTFHKSLRYFFLLWSSSSASAASTFVFLRSMLAVHALSFRTCGNSACSYGRTGSGSSGCGVAVSAFWVSRSHAHSETDHGVECVHYVHTTSADTSTRACTHLHPFSSASFGR